MSKQTHYVAFDSNAYYTSEAETWYKDYVAECEADGVTPMNEYDWYAEMAEQDLDDFFANLECTDFGRVTITGTIGRWNGRFEIMPVQCRDIASAIRKCINGDDGFKVTVWKSKIEVVSWNHDSQYHGPNHFILRTQKKRSEMWLY